MNDPLEAGELLAVCAAFDNRTTGEADIIAWGGALRDLNYAECQQAVIEHYRETPDQWIRPGHVLQRVRAKRRDQIERARPLLDDILPDIADQPAEYIRVLRARTRTVARPRPAVIAPAEQRAIGGTQ